ncbi:MAG: TIGR00645 family protein [Alphaproteobacteria bacterium]|nr:TIGR00645 family protein [Alphaproteobacteria bacterium]
MAKAEKNGDHGSEPRSGIVSKLEGFLERLIFESRWFLLPLFLGLIAALALFSVNFILMIYKFSLHIFVFEKNELLFNMLTFVDKTLVGGLIIMVIIGGYENSVSMLNIKDQDRKLSWLGKLDASTLKIKLSTSIVSISSVHLLKIFLEVGSHTEKELVWTSLIHFLMVLTALILTFMDRLADHGEDH